MKMYTVNQIETGFNRQRGSVLLSAVIFAWVIAMLLGTYLKLASSEYRISSRSYMMNGAFNLAEGGVEFAMDALNKADSTGWTTGSHGGKTYWARVYNGYDFGAGLSGEIRSVIVSPSSSAPTIYSEGRITGSTVGGDMKRQITVTLDSGFFPWKNGVDSKSGFVLSGNKITIDSYNSDLGDYGIPLGGGEYNKNSEATVSTTSISLDAANVGNADIYGYVATGAAAPNVGANGSITSYSTPGVVDLSRVTTDYYAEFPEKEIPDTFGAETTLASNATISTNTLYALSSWSSSGHNTLTIAENVAVTMVVSGDMSMTGNAQIVIEDGGSLIIYVGGDMNLAGSGVMNGSSTLGKPANLQVFGTNTTEGGKDINISGNGQLSAVVYAPNANVNMNGGGSAGHVYGSVVGYNVTFNGGTHFSYDEALSDYNLDDGGYGVDDWVEMTSVGLYSTPVDLTVYGL